MAVADAPGSFVDLGDPQGVVGWMVQRLPSEYGLCHPKANLGNVGLGLVAMIPCRSPWSLQPSSRRSDREKAADRPICGRRVAAGGFRKSDISDGGFRYNRACL